LCVVVVQSVATTLNYCICKGRKFVGPDVLIPLKKYFDVLSNLLNHMFST